MQFPVPDNEAQRLLALRSYDVLDSSSEPEFDALTRLAAHTFGTPMAMIGLMDSQRLWFKSRLGLDVLQLDRQSSVSAHAIAQAHEVLVVDDLRRDARFEHHPRVGMTPGLRFYAGAPIVDGAGHALGTIAVADVQPRVFSQAQRCALKDLSVLTMMALDGRRRAIEIGRMALMDQLTGLCKQAQFDQALEVELRHAMRTGEPFTVLCMNLDGFKAINEGFGHAAGDEVLREVALRLTQQVRLGDVLARLGGDEFGVVMRHGAKDSAQMLAKRIVRAVSKPITLSSGDAVGVGISVGMAAYADSVASVAALLGQAAQALYQAKSQNRRRWNMFVGVR
ncbi:MAG: sensor domain-containing diguanylate cyclase [Burkholderiales bacterium]|nr:sensor domain-containing diguanylate cyclase [Burkholderiales bacterium]